ncbi:MAG: hypothetical protein ABIJ09_10225 [Pseudomonadota bacterium]
MRVRHLAVCASSILLLVACRPRVDPDPPAAPASPTPSEAPQVQPLAQPAGPTPELFLPENRFDGGKVKQGEPIRHTFIVKNKGLGELNIEKVQGS